MHVGQLLRGWRAHRGMSQFELALHSGFSARHVSFIETGRTQPSRQALLALAESLEIPLRERNRLLEAGGYAHVYGRRPLDAEEMAHVRSVLQYILARHEPYAAVVLDRYANCLMGNETSALFMSKLVDPSLMRDNASYLRLLFHPLGARRWIVNWSEVGRHMLERATRELMSLNDDGDAVSLLTELRGYAEDLLQTAASPSLPGAADLLLPVHLRLGDIELRLFSTIMTLGTPQDVTLQELRIETFFPADERSEEAWRALTGREDS